MQTWAKRGFQTALVTGGLLMLGTGIASADEDVNPDKPASPLDGSVTVPVKIDNNAFGTPLGQKNLPGVDNEIRVSVADLTRSVPMADQATTATSVAAPFTGKVQGTAAPVATKVKGSVDPLTGKARDQAAPLVATAEPVTDKLATLPMGDKIPTVPSLDAVNTPGVDAIGGSPAAGNRVNGDLVVPVDVSGNAVAIVGKAEVANDSEQSAEAWRDVETDGSHGFLSGNAVDLDWALPVQVTGNAVAAGGKAIALSSATQDATAGGDVETDGSHGFLSGNALVGQFATPLQANGNAIAGAGRATAASEAETSATSGGTVLTSGEDSAGGGNVGAAPVAVPLKANGNAIMGLGKANAWADSVADAAAGDTRQGMYGVPTYVETNGDPALLAGNIAQPAVSGPALLCGNAGGAVGTAAAECDTASETTAGGTSRTTGEGSVLSGAIAATPVALPVEGFGNAAAAVGKASAEADNTVDSTAGGSSYTRGHESVLSGTAANTPLAGPVDVFANSVAGVGGTSATATNDATTSSGGNTGTTGDESLGGGNMGTIPLTLPVEGFGNAAAGAGGADATGSETKKSTSGGGNNTDDDDGVVASNLVTAPVATAGQVFGNGAGAVAFTDAKATTDNELAAGGPSKATGTAGFLSGNIGQAPVSVPAQVFGSGASALAKGTQAAVNNTEMTSGGDATSDGVDGAGTGNVVNAPVAGAGQVYGESAAALGLNDSLAGSVTETEAGGDTETDGTSGLVAGNVASPQALPLAQSFAAVASAVGGVNSAVATNKTEAESGGDIDTAGDEGFISGNLVDVPAAAVVQPFGDAVAALAGDSYASGLSNTEGEVGGTSTTSGDHGSLSGIDGTLPVGANVPVYDVPVEVLARAFTESFHASELEVGENESQINLPVHGGLEATELPSLLPSALPSRGRSMPADPFAGAFSGVLTGVNDSMAALTHGQVVDLGDTVPSHLTVDAPVDNHILPAPYPMGRAAAPVGGDLLGGGLLGGDLLGGHLFGGLLGGDMLGGVTGGLPVSQLPVSGVGGRQDVPALPVGGDVLGGDLLGGHLFGGLLGGDMLGGVTGGLPVSQLPVSELPVSGVSGREDVPALPVGGDVLGGDLLGGLLGGGLLGGDMLGGVTGGLPVSQLPVSSLPVSGVGGRQDVPAVPVELPELLPVFGDLTDTTAVIPAVPATDDLTDTTAVLPVIPATDDLTSTTAIIPVIPAAGDLTDITSVIPVVPALPGAGDVNAVPVVQAPSLNTLPVSNPGLSGVQAPVMGDSSLDATRAALANLFTTHPIA